VARSASTVLVVALLAATAAAFALTEGLKLEPSPITGPIDIPKVFSPVCDCESDAARIGFRLRERDVLDVSVVDGGGDVVSTIARGSSQRAGLVSFTWDGRDGERRIVAEGEYRPRVHLREARQTITLPNPIRVDLTPPVVGEVQVSPRVISPDGDGRADAVTVRYRFDEAAQALLFVDGERRVRTRQARTESKLVWSGRVGGRGLPAATYQLGIAARDPAGNVSEPTELVPLRIRYVALGRPRVDVVAGGRFAIRVSADARTVRWQLGSRSGTASPGTIRLRAPLQKGRFTLVVSSRGHSARAAVYVRERP
jgi:hypothetical protein